MYKAGFVITNLQLILQYSTQQQLNIYSRKQLNINRNKLNLISFDV